MPSSIGYGLAALLGVVQGLTEFLPISSDGHLAIAAHFFGNVELPLAMVVFLHLGTLIATMIVLRDDVARLLRETLAFLRAPRTALATAEGRTIATVLVATVPTGIVGLALHDAVEPWSHDMRIVAACLLGSALFVGSTERARSRATRNEPSLAVGPAVFLGLVQGLAVLPGLTRSGSTIAVAMWLGLTGPAAFRLSFLLSLPAVAGAVLLELRHPEVWSTLGGPGVFGAAIAFVVGLAALAALRSIVARGRFWVFAVYLVPLAVVVSALG